MRRAVLVGLWLFTAGCFVDRSGVGHDEDGGRPEVPDGASSDGASLDGASVDAGRLDGGPADAGPLDAGPPDAGPPDAGPPDAGPPDAGPPFCDRSDPSLRFCLRCEGEVRDESVAANPLTVSGVSFGAGAVGDGCHLVSASRVVAMATAALNVTELTVEAFVTLDALPTGGARVGIVDKNGVFGLFVYDGGLLRCTAGGAVVEAAAALSSGGWHHVACVVGATGAALYVDGTVVAEQPGATLGVNDETLHVGSNSPDGASALVGAIDELRIFAVPRDVGEIVAAAARR